jgi:predicted ribonuclease YlaK/intein/homing endonuclease
MIPLKTYVLDTSALISDPSAFKRFSNSQVVIPIAVLNELDKLKKLPNEAGKNARVCIRLLDEISNKGDITTGILLDNDVLLRIDATYLDTTVAPYLGLGDPTYGDTQILACLQLNWHENDHDVVLVSNDINLRIKAKARGIEAESYQAETTAPSDLYAGVQTIINQDAGLELQQSGFINPKNYGLQLLMHECVIFQDEYKNVIALGRKVAHNKVKLIKKVYPWNLSARNDEQIFLMDLILDTHIDLVSATGMAGCGKSICAIAAALELTLNKKEYEKLIIYRPIQPMGSDVGYLPGPQPLDAKILTPTGWTTMGEIKVGSKVIARDGSSTEVIGVFPKGIKSVYKITTTDETSTECCEDHLWYTQTAENRKRQKDGSIKSTKEIKESLFTKKEKYNHFLPRNEAINFYEQKIFIPPYLMGVILGDGSSGDKTSIYNTDIELIERCQKDSATINCSLTDLGNNIHYSIRSNIYNNKPARPVQIIDLKTNQITIYPSIGIACKNYTTNRGTFHNRCENELSIDGLKYQYLPCENRWQNPVKNELHNLKLQNVKAWNKFIPDIYKYNSIENRIALLQGLMDTDGTIKKNGEASFCTTSKQLALDVIEIVRSLGGRATLCSRDRIGKISKYNGRKIITQRISYEFTITLPNHINPFFISRKANRHKCSYIHGVGIKSIEYVGEKEVQCIKINHPEHLYLTNDFIVTHNTLEEKLAPWFQATMDSFEYLLGSNKNNNEWKRDLEMLQRKGKIELGALTFIRGRSIPNAIILIDEVQNISTEEIKTILTRAGENTKVILLGDLAQIDSKDLDAMDNGLTFVIEKFKASELSGHISLVKGERSRLATKAAELL